VSTLSLILASGDVSLRGSRSTVGDRCVVTLTGELDIATGKQLRRLLLGVVRSAGTRTVVLDLSDVTFVDACAIGVIVDASEVAALAGREFRLVGVQGLPERVFCLVGLGHMLRNRDGPVGHEGLRDAR
jgi:anti-anti-sigma factor